MHRLPSDEPYTTNAGAAAKQRPLLPVVIVISREPKAPTRKSERASDKEREREREREREL